RGGAVRAGDLAEPRGHGGATDARKVKLVQRPPMAFEVASGVAIAPRTQPALLARQKAADDGAERLVGSTRAGLGSLDGGVVAEPDPGGQNARRLARPRRVRDLCRAERPAALTAAER